MSEFVTEFKPLYDDLTRVDGLSVARALEMTAAFEEGRGLGVPAVYVSTAITSGGYARDKSLSRDEVIAANNRSGRLIAGSLNETRDPVLAPDNSMLPTELGHVRNWKDSDYILFYFCWLSGLSVSATAWIEQQLEGEIYKDILADANKTKRENGERVPNEERWPAYKVFVEVVLANLTIAEARPGGRRAENCEFMLQLVDVDYSLGCRAEEMYAEARRLDLLAPTFAPDLPSPLSEDVAALRKLEAKVGVERRPVELVPVHLR